MSRVPLRTMLPTAVAAALIAGAAALEGYWSGRWSGPTASGVETLLERAPAMVGDWEREENPVRIETAPAAVQCVYRRSRPRAAVILCLVAGNRRELALHGPAACYPQLSLRLAAEPERQTLELGKLQAELWTSGFWREEPSGRRRLQALWTSRSAGKWAAAEGGRLGDELVKLYLFTDEPVAQVEAGAVLLEFARVLLPELDALLPSSPSINNPHGE